MEILNLKVNGIKNPLGFDLKTIYISYELDAIRGNQGKLAQLEISLDENFREILYNSGLLESNTNSNFYVNIQLATRTRYFYRVRVKDDNNKYYSSKIEWFETGKMEEEWSAQWISTSQNISHPIFLKNFNIHKEIVSARLYCCGLGLYEAKLNGKRIGDEQLSPGYHDYSKWLQVQTYDITELLSPGNNSISFLLGNGWYKGNFGFNGGQDNIYGDQFLLISEMHLTYSDGTSEVVSTDDSWESADSNILNSGIYYGEDRNDMVDTHEKYQTITVDYGEKLLRDRLSLPIKIKEKLVPVELLVNDKNELILDMGQNMVGWLAFYNSLPKGKEINFEFGEILQDGYFYRKNLRHARAKYSYVSDGKQKWIRPKFTFFGFRYVKISGISYKELKLEHFVGEVLYSDLEKTGNIETSNTDINRLFSNILWGQKGNFLDVPTDCPQRDERMGWTGDVQVFSQTALYNMDTYAFFRKYLEELAMEQSQNGAIPMTIPSMTLEETKESAAVWGDVCTILPWNLYKFYGNEDILVSQLSSMEKWISYIQNNSTNYLWTKGFQFGDWLALDGPSPDSPFGGTEEVLIASVYAYYSTLILAKSMKILGKSEADQYFLLASQIKIAIQDEYLSSNGRLVISTQTAYTLILYFELFQPHQKETLLENFKKLLRDSNYYIQSGFVGTPLICLTLSKYGEDEIAYTLLFNRECPSWLYAIDMGATTIWERWDSVLPDGKMNPNGMNSLNHYAYGSIGQWMYEYLLGIKQTDEQVGFKEVIIQPQINWRLKHVKGYYHSPAGKIEVNWKKMNQKIELSVMIPEKSKGTLVLEDTTLSYFDGYEGIQKGDNVEIILSSGKYKFIYQQDKIMNIPNVDLSLEDFIVIPVGYQLLQKYIPKFFVLKPYKQDKLLKLKLNQLLDQQELSIDRQKYTQLLEEVNELTN